MGLNGTGAPVILSFASETTFVSTNVVPLLTVLTIPKGGTWLLTQVSPPLAER